MIRQQEIENGSPSLEAKKLAKHRRDEKYFLEKQDLRAIQASEVRQNHSIRNAAAPGWWSTPAYPEVPTNLADQSISLTVLTTFSAVIPKCL